MTSQIAIDTIEQMQADRLQPTAADIIRLNAMGLRVDEAQGRRLDRSLFTLPRVAVVSASLTFRQPTVGHEIWLDRVMRFVDETDYETSLAVNCYALSRPHTDLPDPDRPATIQSAAAAFAADCASVCRDVLYAAICYVRFGADPAVGERGPRREAHDDAPTPDQCVAVGLLREGAAMLFGLSLADLKSMTADELRTATRRAYLAHGLSLDKTAEHAALGDFYSVADEIRARLSRKEETNGQ